MGKTIEIPIELADCIKCDKELPAYIDKMKEELGSINKACQHVEEATKGAIKAETARQAHKRKRGLGTNVPKKKIKEWPRCRECGNEYVRNNYIYRYDTEIDTPSDDLLCEKCLEKQYRENEARDEQVREELKERERKVQQLIQETGKQYKQIDRDMDGNPQFLVDEKSRYSLELTINEYTGGKKWQVLEDSPSGQGQLVHYEGRSKKQARECFDNVETAVKKRRKQAGQSYPKEMKSNLERLKNTTLSCAEGLTFLADGTIKPESEDDKTCFDIIRRALPTIIMQAHRLGIDILSIYELATAPEPEDVKRLN